MRRGMEKNWNGLPYSPVSDSWKLRWGGDKVYKIPVTTAEDCPNRLGLKGMQTCIFCDEWGSAADSNQGSLSLQEQIQNTKLKIKQKYKAKKFLVYFQAYTSTFAHASVLRKQFDLALEDSEVVGFVVGTRPDCLSRSVIDLWREYQQKTYVSIELGLQSLFDDQLEFLRRGHSSEDSLRALKLLTRELKVDLGVHLMFGLPGETLDDLVLTAQTLNDFSIHRVKLHNLHVLKNTPLEDLYYRKIFEPVSFTDYKQRVEIFLRSLSPLICIDRLAAYSSRWEELVAPAWTSDKMKSHQEIIDHLRSQGSFQSRDFSPRNVEEKKAQERLRVQSLRSVRLFKNEEFS